MSEFADFVCDTFAPMGDIQCRKMFGGYGVYHRGLMFALIADDTLYLKTDDESSESYLQRGLDQFEYPRRGKMIKMSYFQAPEEVFEDQQEALAWGGRAFQCAAEAKAGKKKGP